MERRIDGKITSIPSKLIDYHLSNRPIYSYEYGQLETNILNDFINGNYYGQYIDTDLNRFDIKDVCLKFLSLDH